MGGIGSGARRSTHIGNVEDALVLDVRALRRLGVVRAGECVIQTVHWPVDAPAAPKARLRVDLSDIERGGTLTITGTMPDGAITQQIAIEAVGSSLGGYRCYFLCPVTRDRCEVLYYIAGRFASRRAQRLSYAVQGMSELSRVRRKVAKLRSRLGGSSVLPRARGLNRLKIACRLEDAELNAKALYRDRLRAHAERSDTRWRPRASQ